MVNSVSYLVMNWLIMVIDGESAHLLDHAGEQWAVARVLTERKKGHNCVLIKIKDFLKRDYFLKWTSKMTHR